MRAAAPEAAICMNAPLESVVGKYDSFKKAAGAAFRRSVRRGGKKGLNAVPMSSGTPKQEKNRNGQRQNDTEKGADVDDARLVFFEGRMT